MFVLGIDPGLSRCGYGAVVREGAGFLARAAGVITTPAGEAVPRRLAMLRYELTALLDELQPDVVVVERIFFRSNARTAMFVGQASGVALLSAIEHGCSVVEITNAEAKLAVTGYGNASKEQVQAMIRRLLGLAELPGPADVADALALAVCYLGAAPWARAAGAGAPGPGGAAIGAAGAGTPGPGGAAIGAAGAGAAIGAAGAIGATADREGGR